MFDRLIQELRSRNPLERTSAEVGALLKASVLEGRLAPLLVFRRNAYTRTCAYRDTGFEVAVLNWDKGATSPVHDHGDQRCWMLVLEGSLRVDDYARLDAGDVAGYAHVERRGARMLEVGDMDLRSGRFDLHRVSACPDVPAVSLHVYAGPLREFLVYDEYARQCQRVYGNYDEVLPLRSLSQRATVH
jgi:cysteine dioxygenase